MLRRKFLSCFLGSVVGAATMKSIGVTSEENLLPQGYKLVKGELCRKSGSEYYFSTNEGEILVRSCSHEGKTPEDAKAEMKRQAVRLQETVNSQYLGQQCRFFASEPVITKSENGIWKVTCMLFGCPANLPGLMV